MSSTAFAKFLSNYPLIVFEKGQMILLKDEIPKGAYVVESGDVKTFSIDKNGYEQIISMGSRGDDIPVGFTAGLIDKSQYFYQAHTNCRVRVVPCGDFIEHLAVNHESLIARHSHVTKILLDRLKHIEALEQSNAGDKITLALLYLAETMSSTYPNKKIRRLTLTQQEIANSLGLTRETASIILKKLELKNLLAYSRNTYILYIEKLRKYTERKDD